MLEQREPPDCKEIRDWLVIQVRQVQMGRREQDYKAQKAMQASPEQPGSPE